MGPEEKRKLLVRTDVRMIRWVMHISLREHKTNQVVRQLTGVERTEVQLRDARLHWYGQGQGKENDRYLRKAADLPVDGKRAGERRLQQWKDSLIITQVLLATQLSWIDITIGYN